MTNENNAPKFQITREELDKMKEVDIRTVDPDTLMDIDDVKINMDLPCEERILDYIRQIKNPYCYRCKGMVVKISFSGKRRFEDCLKAILDSDNGI